MNSPNPAYYEALATARGVRPAPARSWSILLTSTNHGVVGPRGSTFPHAGEHHERVVVVEVPAGAGAPSDEVNLVLRTASAIGAGANPALEEQRIWQLYQEAQDQGASPRGISPTVHFARAIEREVAAQAGQVAPAQPLAMVSPSELRDIKAGRGGVPVRGNQWRADQTVPIYAAPVAGQVAVPEGWKLVPVESCGKMTKAGEKALRKLLGSTATTFDAYSCYAAMLAAAPSAPAVAQQAPAATIDTREFRELLAKAMDAAELATRTGDPHRDYKPARDALVAHIDARLGAQASTSGERREGGDRG